MNLDKEILKQQKSEITEHHIYKKLSKISKNKKNKQILEKISNEELGHHNIWENITKKSVKPNWIKVYFYVILAKILGLAFSLRFMENREENAQEFYKSISKQYPKAATIKKDEEEHERQLIRILKDRKLEYTSSIVLGLNDALVELTGTLAGLSLAFSNNTIIAFTGLIMGFAASLSMATSEYLSSKEEKSKNKNPLTSALYTGLAYVLTVIVLVTPYFIFDNSLISLAVMLCLTIIIIASYTFYISVAKEKKFFKHFFEMSIISLGVAAISFVFGILIKYYFGLDI